MAEQVATLELRIIQEQKQDCGCGCGGALCETARQDCGCGCGGDHCGALWQELVLVGAAADRDINESATQRCDGECGCRG